MEMEKKKHYAKLDMHNIKNANGRIVKDDSMSGQSETDGLDCQERVKNLRWHRRNRSSNEAHDAHIA